MAFALQGLGAVAVVGAAGKLDALGTVGTCPTRKAAERLEDKIISGEGKDYENCIPVFLTRSASELFLVVRKAFSHFVYDHNCIHKLNKFYKMSSLIATRA